MVRRLKFRLWHLFAMFAVAAGVTLNNRPNSEIKYPWNTSEKTIKYVERMRAQGVFGESSSVDAETSQHEVVDIQKGRPDLPKKRIDRAKSQETSQGKMPRGNAPTSSQGRLSSSKSKASHDDSWKSTALWRIELAPLTVGETGAEDPAATLADYRDNERPHEPTGSRYNPTPIELIPFD